MPRTSDYFLDCVLYVFGSNETAIENSSPAGSGFLAAAPLVEGAMLHQFYAVTAAHVVRRAKTPFLRVNKRFVNDVEVMEAPASSWVQHPNGDDVSMCPLQLPTRRLQTLGIETARFVTADILETEDIGIGDEIFMVGRFAQHSGSRTRNIPVARFGNIAAMPTEPLLREDGIKQESFLVECRSVPGYSGSPVFIYKLPRFEQPGDLSPITGGRVTKWNGVKQLVSDSYWLLGLDWCHLQDFDTKANTGMAGVIPAWKILELINCDQFVQQRQEVAKRIQGEGGDSWVTQVLASCASRPLRGGYS